MRTRLTYRTCTSRTSALSTSRAERLAQFLFRDPGALTHQRIDFMRDGRHGIECLFPRLAPSNGTRRGLTRVSGGPLAPFARFCSLRFDGGCVALFLLTL